MIVWGGKALPKHMRKPHNDWMWPFSLVPRGWTAWKIGAPRQIAGNQQAYGANGPLPIGEPGSWQLSMFPKAGKWWPVFLYFAVSFPMRGDKFRHFRIGARWDNVDEYVQWPSIATRKFTTELIQDTSC